MACCSGKTFVWLAWALNTFISGVYLGLAATSYNSVTTGVSKLVGDQAQITMFRNCLLASCILGFLIVIFWVLLSFLIMLGKLFGGDIKLWYGIVLGAAFHTAWFQLLAGLVLQFSERQMQVLKDVGIWSTRQFQSYQATYVFSYILVASYFVMFWIMLFGRKCLGKAELAAAPAGALPPAANSYIDMGRGQGSQV
ncbi:hypothetical protein V8C86DRAFT_1008754 [Haematococcus lacustris]